MIDTPRIVIAIDRDSESGCCSYVQESPAGTSRFVGFKWPFDSSLQNRQIDLWFTRPSDVPPVELGKEIWSLAFPGQVGDKLREALTRSSDARKTLVAITSASPEIHRIPFEIAHDGREYLASGNRIVIRYVNRASDVTARFADPRRFLVVLADPASPDYDHWDHDGLADKIRKLFDQWGVECKILEHATPTTLVDELARQRQNGTLLDVIFVVAHGEAATPLEDGHVVLEDEAGLPELMTGSALATASVWHKGCLTVLCSCSTAAVSCANPLGGVAQRLVTIGPASAVAAMQRPVTTDTGVRAGIEFLSSLRRGSMLFDAFRDSLVITQAGWEHGVPCLYTRQVEGTQDEDTLRLMSLLSANPRESRFAIIVPGLRMGLKESDFQRAKAENWINLPKGQFHYAGKTTAMTAFKAVKDLIAVLGRFFPPAEFSERITIAADDETENLINAGQHTHFVLIGTKSHQYSRQVLQQYSDDFEFQFDRDDWSIIDKRENKTYAVPDPSQVDESGNLGERQGTDYALIEKIIDEIGNRVIFVIGGMRDMSSLAAGNYFMQHWKDIHAEFGSGGFQLLLGIAAGSTHVQNVIVRRRPRRVQR